MAFCDFGIIWSSDVSYCQIDNMIHYVGAAIFHVSASDIFTRQAEPVTGQAEPAAYTAVLMM